MKNLTAIVFVVACLTSVLSYVLPEFFYSYELEKTNYFFVKDGMRSLSWSLLILSCIASVGNNRYLLLFKGLAILLSLNYFIDAFDRIVRHSNEYSAYDAFAIVSFIILSIPILWRQWQK